MNVPDSNYPLESITLGFSTNDYMVTQMVSLYYKLGAREKALELARKMGGELLVTAKFYLEFYDYADSDFELVGQYLYFLADEMEKGGDAEEAKKLTDAFAGLVSQAS